MFATLRHHELRLLVETRTEQRPGAGVLLPRAAGGQEAGGAGEGLAGEEKEETVLDASDSKKDSTSKNP